MNVTLLRHDPDALDLLVLTKQTRLSFSATDAETVKAWPLSRKLEELNYMLGTIESSWEFCDYVFLITGVSRAFTHQFVRTREGSYAQQSQRTVNMGGFDYITTGAIVGHEDAQYLYNTGMQAISNVYQSLITLGIPPQDARGLLPTNVATAIVAKFNLRTLSHMAQLRLCTRTQGEYQDVFRAMRAAVVAVHPWAEPFLRVYCAKTGVCAFPHYTECPIKGPIYNPDSGRRWDMATRRLTVLNDHGSVTEYEEPKLPHSKQDIQEAWEKVRFEARPKETPRATTD